MTAQRKEVLVSALQQTDTQTGKHKPASHLVSLPPP